MDSSISVEPALYLTAGVVHFFSNGFYPQKC
jgi:hypothetical protein